MQNLRSGSSVFSDFLHEVKESYSKNIEIVLLKKAFACQKDLKSPKMAQILDFWGFVRKTNALISTFFECEDANGFLIFSKNRMFGKILFLNMVEKPLDHSECRIF